MAGKMEVYKCNIDENPEIPSKYAVRGIPTLMIFKDGKLVDTKVGSLPKAALFEWAKNNL
jgi:thioredoxin 1